MYTAYSYAAYLAISVSVAVWVTITFQKNSRAYLVDLFHGNGVLADSVNHVVVAGFCLVNMGNITLALSASDTADSLRQAVGMVSGKIGWVLMVLGLTHFLSLCIYNCMRRRAKDPILPPHPPNARVAL